MAIGASSFVKCLFFFIIIAIDASQKNASYQPQQPSGPYMNGPPPPAYTKEAEASAPQVYAQYPVAHQPQGFHPGMQQYTGTVHYGQAQQPNMYYQQQMPMPMQPGMYMAQPQYQAGPPPGYGGGPQYPTGYCPPPPYQSPIHVQHQQTVYHQAGVPVK